MSSHNHVLDSIVKYDFPSSKLLLVGHGNYQLEHFSSIVLFTLLFFIITSVKAQDASKSDTLIAGPLIIFKNASNEHSDFTKQLNNKDSISHLFQSGIAKRLSSYGSISLGYEYGLMPFALNMKVPDGYFNSDGNIGIELSSLPFTLLYRYSNFQSISGMTNYFRISFDSQAYKSKIQSKVSTDRAQEEKRLEDLQKERQSLTQKLFYYKYLKYGSMLSKDSIYQSIQNDTFISSASLEEPELKESIQDDTLKEPALNKTNSKIFDNDSTLDVVKSYPQDQEISMTSVDSLVDDRIARYEALLQSEDEKIAVVKKELILLQDNSIRHGSIPSKYASSTINRIIYYTKKLEIGLCYPSYSSFLVSGIAVRGVNFEYETDRFFFATTFGKTINNLFYTGQGMQSVVHGGNNILDIFDFNNVESGRRILSFKVGAGTKEGNHFFVGLLYGVGKSSYFNSEASNATGEIKERNYVGEVDGRYKFTRSLTMDLIYGKSSLQADDVKYNSYEEGFGALLNSNDRSQALMAKISISLKKLGNRLQLTGRKVEPFFYSYGVGFIRADNLRYEIKSEQSLFKSKIRLSLFYRNEEDNLLNLMTYKNTITSSGVSFNCRFTSRINFRLDYMPIVQRSSTEIIANTFRNSISNLVVSFLPGNETNKTNLNLLYSHYKFEDGIRNNLFESASVVLINTFGERMNNELSGNWFDVNTTDSLNGQSVILKNEVMYKIDSRLTIAGNLKFSKLRSETSDWGYGGKVKYSINSYFGFECSMDKLIIGDFYSSYPFSAVNKFPYYASSSLIFHW